MKRFAGFPDAARPLGGPVGGAPFIAGILPPLLRLRQRPRPPWQNRSSPLGGADAEPDLRYPIGHFTRPAETTDETRAGWIEEIAAVPETVRAAVAGLDDEQLDTPYRPGGWTVRQVVHHLPDSHLNAYVRCKLALTEEEPAIRTYQEARWAELPEARTAPLAVSLALLDSLHERWVLCLRCCRRPPSPAPGSIRSGG